EGRGRHLRAEEVLVLLLGELEERQRPTVTDAEEAMTIDAQRAEQFVGLAPGGHQREAEQVLVEPACRLHVARHVSVVVETGGKVAGSSGHWCPPVGGLQFQNRREAISAPCASAASLRHTTSLSTGEVPTWIENPQSAPATMFSRPTRLA